GALVETSGAGWVVPLGDWRGLADRIAALAQAREEIEAKADAALSFAKNHLFEHEFDRRIEHLSGLV
ncbi:MAG: glycosyl transferase group 1, partial [Pseudomonadota bacterium]